MYYDRFFPFYVAYANPALYDGERIQEQVCADEILLSRGSRQDPGKSGGRMPASGLRRKQTL